MTANADWVSTFEDRYLLNQQTNNMQITIDIDEEELSALSNISSITFITPDRHQKRFTDVLSVVEKISNAVEGRRMQIEQGVLKEPVD